MGLLLWFGCRMDARPGSTPETSGPLTRQRLCLRERHPVAGWFRCRHVLPATAGPVAVRRERGNAPELRAASAIDGTSVAPLGSTVQTTRPLWDTLTNRPALPRDPPPHLHVDVAIVGGGITGLTSAALLAAEGSSVALLEAREIGSGVTSGSTGHVTQMLDMRYADIERRLGMERTRLVA